MEGSDDGTKADAGVEARFDAATRALLKRAQRATGKTASVIVKEALRLYCDRLPSESPLEIFRLPSESPLEIFARHGVIGAVEGPEDLSQTYKTPRGAGTPSEG